MINGADFAQGHFLCADVVQIDCDSASELAMLLEIWEGGGTIHTSFPIAKGSPIDVGLEKTHITAEVTECEPDHDFGYLINIGVSAAAKWFPISYVPAWHRPAIDSTVSAGELVN